MHKIGDIVVLNSGSPNMTVTHVNEDLRKIECKWWCYNTHILHFDHFPFEAVRNNNAHTTERVTC